MNFAKTWSGTRPGSLVEDPEADADEQEEGELGEDHEPARDQRRRGLPLRAGREVALDHHLIGPVGGRVQHHPADQARPERVRLGEVEREAEHAELAGGAAALQSPDQPPGSLFTRIKSATIAPTI